MYVEIHCPRCLAALSAYRPRDRSPAPSLPEEPESAASPSPAKRSAPPPLPGFARCSPPPSPAVCTDETAASAEEPSAASVEQLEVRVLPPEQLDVSVSAPTTAERDDPDIAYGAYDVRQMEDIFAAVSPGATDESLGADDIMQSDESSSADAPQSGDSLSAEDIIEPEDRPSGNGDAGNTAAQPSKTAEAD